MQRTGLLDANMSMHFSHHYFESYPSRNISLRGMVVIKGRRPVLGGENEGYDTDEDSDDEGNTKSMPEESKVSVVASR